MNLPTDNTILYSQRKNKCYCRNGNICYCNGIENSLRNSRQSSYKFIKVRNEEKKQNKSTPLCSSKSFSPAPTLMNSISALSMTTTSGVISEPKLTGRRELYEKYKTEKQRSNHKFDVSTWAREDCTVLSCSEHSDLFSEEKIAKLQEFRLQNPDECLNSCNKCSMDKIKQLSKPNETVVERKYTLNSRGLLKTIGSNDDKRAAIVHSKSAVKDILREKLNASKDKATLILKTLCHPENSLALRYQKSYKT